MGVRLRSGRRVEVVAEAVVTVAVAAAVVAIEACVARVGLGLPVNTPSCAGEATPITTTDTGGEATCVVSSSLPPMAPLSTSTRILVVVSLKLLSLSIAPPLVNCCCWWCGYFK